MFVNCRAWFNDSAEFSVPVLVASIVSTLSTNIAQGTGHIPPSEGDNVGCGPRSRRSHLPQRRHDGVGVCASVAGWCGAIDCLTTPPLDASLLAHIINLAKRQREVGNAICDDAPPPGTVLSPRLDAWCVSVASSMLFDSPQVSC